MGIIESFGNAISPFPDARAFLWQYDMLASQNCLGVIEGYFAISIAALLVSISIISISYMFSYLFPNNKLRAWAKLELFELFVTSLILLAIPSLQGFYCSFSFLGNNGLFADSALVLTTINRNLYVSGILLSTISSVFDFLTSVTLTAEPLGFGASNIQPLIGIAVFFRPLLSAALTTLSTGIVLNSVFLIVVDYFSYGFMISFMPLGIFLRSFSPTRKLGGSIIALGISFSFIYPLLIAIEGMILDSIGFGGTSTTNFINTLNQDIANGVSNIPIIGPILEKFYNLFPTLFAAPLSLLSASLVEGALSAALQHSLGNLFGLGAGLGFLFASVSSLLLFIFMAIRLFVFIISYGFLTVLLFPGLNFVVLVTAVRDLSRIIGEQIDISNLTRLI